MNTPSSDKPLMPYASHVAHGTGRTPIGIILFAGSHLLLGGLLAWCLAGAWREIRSLSTLHPSDWLSLLLVMVLATSMLVAGCAILLKGRMAWRITLAACSLLSLGEAVAAAFGAGMMVRFDATGDRAGIILGLVLVAIMSALLALCVIVLRYLSLEKGRLTFALAPGETSAIARWLPAAAVGAYVFMIIAGLALGGAEFWTRR